VALDGVEPALIYHPAGVRSVPGDAGDAGDAGEGA
jgi:hypothetical protein